MNPQKSSKLREKFRTIHYIFYIEYERLEFLFNYPINLLNMEFVNREESKKKQSIVVMDLDELEKRLSKGYRVYKKIRTTLNLKDEWDFIKLKILFMRQYSQLFMDDFKPDLGYFYLQKADDYVEKRKKINRSAQEDDVNFYKYLVEIDRSNYYILTNQYNLLLQQCETYIECASKLEEYKKKPINVLVPFRIYVGCGMIYEFFNQDNDLVVNSFLRGVQIIEKNIDDVGRYFLQNDLLIYVQAYVKIVKCKLRLRDYENAELWARSILNFIETNYYLLRLEADSKVVKKIKKLHSTALKELIAVIIQKSENKKKQDQQQQQQKEESQNSPDEPSQISQIALVSPLPLSSQVSANIAEKFRIIKLQNGASTNRNYNSPVNYQQGGDTFRKKVDQYGKSKFEIMVKDEDGTVVSQRSPKDTFSSKIEVPQINFEGFEKVAEQAGQNIEAISNQEKIEDNLQNQDPTTKNSGYSQVDEFKKSIQSRDEKDNVAQKDPETQRNIEIIPKGDKQNIENGDINSDMKMREKQQQAFLKNLAQRLVDETKPRNSTNLKPISQIKQEIDDNQDGMDLIQINSQFFDQNKFFNLPKQFPTTIQNFDNGLEIQESKEELKQDLEEINQDKQEKIISIKKITSQVTESEESNSSKEDISSPRSRSNSMQSNRSNNESQTSIRRYSRMSIKSLQNIEAGGSEKKISSYTIMTGQKKRNSFLEVPNTNYSETQDKSLSNTKNFNFAYQEHSQSKISSNRMIHLIPENQSEDDSPIKKLQNQKQGSLNHIKFESPKEKKSENKSNYQQGNSLKSIPITPTSLVDCFESPKSNLYLQSSKQIDITHFAIELDKNGPLPTDFSNQKQSPKQDAEDLNNNNLSRITKINRSEIIDTTINSERKQNKKQPSFTDLNESQNKSITNNFQTQKISSFNHIEQIPEAFEDDSPHKFTKSRDPTPQYFYQIKLSTQQSALNENIKIESNKDITIDKETQNTQQREQTPAIQNNKDEQKNNQILAQDSPQRFQETQIQEKTEQINSQDSINKGQGGVQNQQQILAFKDQKRPSLLVTKSSYQSPFITPNAIISPQLQNQIKASYSASSSFNPSPELHSPNSVGDIKIDFTKVQSINQTDRDYTNKLSDSKNQTDSQKDETQPASNRFNRLTKEFNKQLSSESNEYFARHRNSFSIQLSENNYTQNSLQKFPYSSDNQTPANHFLGCSNYIINNGNNIQTQGQNNLLMPQTSNQTRKKSIFSDLKEQQELQNKLEKIQLEVEKIDTDRSSVKAFTPKRSKYGLFSDKDQKQTEQNNKFKEYLTKTESRAKQGKQWYGGNLNIFFKNEGLQNNTKQQPVQVQQSPQKKIEYPQIRIKSGSKSISKLDESEQSIFQFQQKKIDLAEQSFKLNLDYRPSIITPSNNILTPFLGQNDNQKDIKSFTQGINYQNTNQVYLTPDNSNQLNKNLIKQEQKAMVGLVQTNQTKIEIPSINLQIPEIQGEKMQIQQKSNLEDQLQAEPPMIIFQNKISDQSANPNLNHRRFSSRDQSTFKQIIQAKARSSMVNLDDLQKQIIIQTDRNQLSINTQQNQTKKNFFSQQISPVSLRQSSPKTTYFPSCNSNSNLNSINNIQLQIPSQYNSSQISLKQNSTPKIQQTSLSHQVSPITDRQVGTSNLVRFFPNSKSQQSSKLNSPFGRQQNEQKLVNEEVPSKVQTNIEDQQTFSKIKKINDDQTNSQGNTQNGQQNKKIIRIMSKLSSRDLMSPEDMYLFQYSNPKQNSQTVKKYNSELQTQSQLTKSNYPALYDSKQNQQKKQIQLNDNERRFNSQPINAQQKFIGIQAPQQLQQYHKINQAQSSNLLNHQTYFNKQQINTKYQSGAANKSEQNKPQNYQQPSDSTSKHKKANSQSNVKVYRFQTEGNNEEAWKNILAIQQDLIPRPSNGSNHRRIKTQASSSKTQTPHRCSTEEFSYENLQNQGKFLEYWQGYTQVDDEEQFQDETTTLDEENVFSARKYSKSNKKNASWNNFGIFSDQRLDSSNSQGQKKTQVNQPFTFSDAELDRYIIQKDIQEVVYLQDYFQNQYPKDFMNSRECRQNIFKKITFKKQLNEEDKNIKNDQYSVKPIQVNQLNDQSQISDQQNQKDKRIKLKYINSIMLDNSNSNCKQEDTDCGVQAVSSKDTNYDMIKSFTHRSSKQKRNSFDLQDRGKIKNYQSQIMNYTPKLRQKKILKYQYEGFSQAYQENEKKDIFYELNNKNQEEQYQKENIVYEDTSSNTPSNSSESESHFLNQSQTIEEKSNAIIQKQFVQFFEEKWKEYNDLQCSIDFQKYPQWVISTQRQSKTTANIIFRTIKNQLSFSVEELFLFPDNLLNSSGSQQSQNRDIDKSSFENNVKSIREKLIVQVCDTNITNIQKESFNQFQYLTFRNSILQSLQVQTNIKKIPVQDKITTIWPIVLCALFDYLKKNYKISFTIPRIKNLIFQGTQCIDKSIKLQKTNKVQFFIEQNHLIPFGIDAISASLIQIMLDQLVRFHLKKSSKLNGNILFFDKNQQNYIQNANKVKQAVTKVQLFLIFDPPIINKPKHKRSFLRQRQKIKQAIYSISYPDEQEKVNNFYWWENALGRITNMEDSEVLINRFKERFVNSRWSFLKFLSRQNENQFYFGWIKMFYIPENGEFESINLFQQQSITKKFFFQLFLQNYSDKKKKMSKIFSLNDFLSLFEENQKPIMSLEEYVMEIIQDKQSKYQNIFLLQCMQQVLLRLKIKESSFFLVLNNPSFGFSNIPTIVSHSFKGKSSYRCSQIIEEPKDEEEQAEVNLNQLNSQKPQILVQDEILTNQIDEQILTKNSFFESSKSYLPCTFASYIYSLIHHSFPSQNQVKKRYNFWLSSENQTLNIFVRKIKSENNQHQNQQNQSQVHFDLSKSNNLTDINYYRRYIEDIPLELSQEISFKNTSNSIIINKSNISNQAKASFQQYEKDNFQSQHSQQNSIIQSDFNEISPKSIQRKESVYLQKHPKLNIPQEKHEIQIFIYSLNQEVIKCGSTQKISTFDILNKRYQYIKQIQLHFLRIYQLKCLNKQFRSLISNQVGGKQSQWKTQSSINSLTLKPIPFEIFKYQLILNNTDEIKKIKPYQEYMFLHKNSELGKLIVRVTVYENPQQLNSLSYILSIQQYNYKNKLWKIIFNSEDLRKYFQLSSEYTFHSVNSKTSDSQFIIRTEKICRIVMDQIILQKQNIYTQPIFKFQIQTNSQPSHINSYLYHKNHFIEPSFKDSDSQCTFYLEQSVKSTRVVAHFIIKRFDQYIITTILRHIIVDIWILKLYLPHSQRRSISYFSTSDLSNLLSSDFRLDWFNLKNNIATNSYHDFMNVCLEKQTIQKNAFRDMISQPSSIVLKKSTIKEALLFQKYTQLDEIKEQSQISEETPNKKQQSEQIKLIKEGFTKQKQQSFLRRLQTNNFEQVGRFLQKNQPFISNLKKVSQEINEQLIDQMNNNIATLSNKFIEISAWEDIIQHLQIVQQNSSIFIQFKLSEKISLYEFLDMKLTVNDKGNFVFIEYHLIPLNDKPLNFMQAFSEINYSTSQNYDILMRYSFYDKLNFFSKRVNLKEALNLYIADGFYQYQMSYMHSTLHYSDLLNICKYITYKITSQSIGSIVSIDQEFKYLNESIFSK
ncbi:hypothetical protein TTHERM_00585030 (macronuclear) [Tetrahymena thermophila SB210]|uniref:Uncharacterized protein n=1 Tax=Tetrahymena thermophila (strain SB210) TaxID=312017 RepID=I7M6C3_TETTS|nr:hypothetical protein TTHERM_00585030 [Tetrahymena thermophila SB210]EAR84946.2 hypothetical protein TTHERM_00585030 [Tetrahymena thermophila SB210]|eukprot:XP_001032609.2 hypothetical protein TTHERM_00585030 [Tetrahymena thermophila SB210]